ncbi:hypothetical protein IJH10_01535 [Candidatus Saccharibacteria bacterium]|nr:hypothetical protein [Candidatus Saccharibacteria bacterium]
MPFEFLSYDFDEKSLRATFRYRGGTPENPLEFTKIATFSDRAQNSSKTYDRELLDRALFLSFIINGTSYYKAFPSREVILPYAIDETQAAFFNHVYQDGLSQFAYENQLERKNLAHFKSTSTTSKSISATPKSISTATNAGIIALQSGGKDSLLTAELLNEKHTPWTAVYVSTSGAYPKVLEEIGAENVELINRNIDLETLKLAETLGGKNGHVPVTYINISLALIQAILDGKDTILTSIGHEGEEPHSIIKSTNNEPDLPVNHQWSKTKAAEELLQNYIKNYVSPDFKVYSPLRKYSELKIAELFVKKCWQKFGHKFSSCNVINYGQRTDNSTLRWCGNCAKCANSYLLFAPFLEPSELDSIFPDQKSLFEKPALENDFRGLLGIDNHLKPFECVGEVAELRAAYHLKKPGYKDLPFAVPSSDFDYNKLYE